MIRYFVKRVISILLLSIITCHSNGQNVMIQTNSDFGLSVIFADGSSSYNGPGYSYQKMDKQIISVLYKTFLAFADNTSEGIEDEMLLQVGKKYSKYYSPLLHAADSALHTGGEQLAFRDRLFSKANPIFINDCYYTDLNSGKVNFVCRFATEDFEYTDNIPLIKWKTTEGSMTICGYVCKKAIGTLRGRDYEVWYTEDIPIAVGPWKLRGLPGAILKASDTEGLCNFEAKAVFRQTGIIEKPQYPYVTISRKDYQSMLKQYFKTPARFRSMHMSRAPGIVIRPPAKETPLRNVIILEKN